MTPESAVADSPPGAPATDLEALKAFLEFTDDDAAALAKLAQLVEDEADALVAALYDHLFRFEEARSFFTDPEVLERVQAAVRKGIGGMTAGVYDQSYAAGWLRVGRIHADIGLPPKLYFGAFDFVFRRLAALIVEHQRANPEDGFAQVMALSKLMSLAMSLWSLSYEAHQAARDESQHRRALRELSTPVLRLRPGLLMVPLIGAVDSERAQQFTEELLKAVAAEQATMVIVDITGVADVDSAVANHLAATVHSAKLMGAEVVVAGVSPAMSETIVGLGIDVGLLNPVGDLEDAIERAGRLPRQVRSAARL